MIYTANGNFTNNKTTPGFKSLTTCLPVQTQSLTKEHFGQKSINNLIYTTDGNTGIGIRDKNNKLHIKSINENFTVPDNQFCMKNNNGDEECINYAFLLLAKELIFSILPEESRNYDTLNNLSKDDIKKFLPIDGIIPSDILTDNIPSDILNNIPSDILNNLPISDQE